MSAFMQGLQAGSQVARGWMDTYEDARKRRQAEMLEQQRQGIRTAQPEDISQYTQQQGDELRQLAESGQVDIGYDQERGAYTVTPKGLAPEARGPQTTSVVAPQARRNFLGQSYAPDELTPERVQALREQAMVDTIADPMERQRGLQALRQGQLADMQIAEAKTAAERKKSTEAAQKQLAERFGRGEVMDVPAIYAMAAQTGADATALVQSAADALELTDKQATSIAKSLVRDINSASTSPEKFNELLRSKFDPDPTDNVFPELRTNRDGSLQVFLGDKPLSQVFRGTKDMPALAQVAGFYKDQIEGDPTRTAVQMLALDKLRAQIAASEAAAFKDTRQGLAAGRENAPRPPTIAELNTIAKGMIDSGMEDPDAPGTPLTYSKAMAMARSEAAGVPYKSAADKLVEAMIAQRTSPTAPAPSAAPAAPSRGLFTDPQGRTQLLQPFSDLNSWRRRLVQEQNAADAAGGLTGGF